MEDDSRFAEEDSQFTKTEVWNYPSGSRVSERANLVEKEGNIYLTLHDVFQISGGKNTALGCISNPTSSILVIIMFL
jgi:hypothetical protein